MQHQSEQNSWKRMAGEEAVKYIENGMVIGLGTGTTAAYMIQALAQRLRAGLSIAGAVPTSQATAQLASSLGIPLTDLDAHPQLDLAIDGADEIDSQLRLIKGGGRRSAARENCRNILTPLHHRRRYSQTCSATWAHGSPAGRNNSIRYDPLSQAAGSIGRACKVATARRPGVSQRQRQHHPRLLLPKRHSRPGDPRSEHAGHRGRRGNRTLFEHGRTRHHRRSRRSQDTTKNAMTTCFINPGMVLPLESRNQPDQKEVTCVLYLLRSRYAQ